MYLLQYLKNLRNKVPIICVNYLIRNFKNELFNNYLHTTYSSVDQINRKIYVMEYQDRCLGFPGPKRRKTHTMRDHHRKENKKYILMA